MQFEDLPRANLSTLPYKRLAIGASSHGATFAYGLRPLRIYQSTFRCQGVTGLFSFESTQCAPELWFLGKHFADGITKDAARDIIHRELAAQQLDTEVLKESTFVSSRQGSVLAGSSFKLAFNGSDAGKRAALDLLLYHKLFVTDIILNDTEGKVGRGALLVQMDPGALQVAPKELDRVTCVVRTTLQSRPTFNRVVLSQALCEAQATIYKASVVCADADKTAVLQEAARSLQHYPGLTRIIQGQDCSLVRLCTPVALERILSFQRIILNLPTFGVVTFEFAPLTADVNPRFAYPLLLHYSALVKIIHRVDGVRVHTVVANRLPFRDEHVSKLGSILRSFGVSLSAPELADAIKILAYRGNPQRYYALIGLSSEDEWDRLHALPFQALSNAEWHLEFTLLPPDLELGDSDSVAGTEETAGDVHMFGP